MSSHKSLPFYLNHKNSYLHLMNQGYFEQAVFAKEIQLYFCLFCQLCIFRELCFKKTKKNDI